LHQSQVSNAAEQAFYQNPFVDLRPVDTLASPDQPPIRALLRRGESKRSLFEKSSAKTFLRLFRRGTFEKPV
jgi:hypothetical protein